VPKKTADLERKVVILSGLLSVTLSCVPITVHSSYVGDQKRVGYHDHFSNSPPPQTKNTRVLPTV
jgi:hypothetical protein